MLNASSASFAQSNMDNGKWSRTNEVEYTHVGESSVG